MLTEIDDAYGLKGLGPHMKVHYAVEKPNQWGGYNYRSLCGRENSQSEDGPNRSGDWNEVTCKFCLKQRAVHEKREAANVAKGSK